MRRLLIAALLASGLSAAQLLRGLLATALALCVPVAAQDERALREFERTKTKVLIEAGQRHLNLGAWARNVGLVQQASAEFALAVQVSEYQHPGAMQC